MNRWFLFVGLALALVACGGGGGGGSGGSRAVGSDTPDDTRVRDEDGYSALDGGFGGFAGLPPDNQAAMNSCQATPSINPAATITGRIEFERVPLDVVGLDYDNRAYVPARGVVVEAVAVAAGQCGQEVVARTLSNGEGDYGLQVPANEQVCVQVRAQMVRQTGAARWDVQVTDNTRANAPYYLLDEQPATPAQRPGRDLRAGSGWNAGSQRYSGARAAAPFAILDSLCESLSTVQSVQTSFDLPTLFVRWSEDNIGVDGALVDGEIGTPFFRQVQLVNSNDVVVDVINELFLRGAENANTDEYDPHVIVHESAHYLVSNLSRSDSYGGEHRLSDRLDMTVAFDEGFANAYSGMVLEGVIANPGRYQDTLGNRQASSFRFDLDSNTTGSRGWYSEVSVFKMLYAAFDGDNNGVADTLSLGYAPIHQALLSQAETPALVTAFSFFAALKQQNPGASTGLDLLLLDQGFEAGQLDAWGSQETALNNTGISGATDVLPVYTPLVLNTPVNLCSNDQFGLFNKLGVVQYLRFTAPSRARYRVTAEPLTSNARAVVEFYQQGQFLGGFEAGEAGELLNASLTLPAGDNVLALYHYDNVFEDDGDDPGRRCFQLTIN